MNEKLIAKDLNQNYKYHSADFFARKYGVERRTILRVLRENHILKDKAALWKEQEPNIIKDYNNGTPLNALGSKYKHTEADIRSLLQRKGIKIRSATSHATHYKYDETFFKNIDSHEKAYWLGFIAADGNICTKKAGRCFQVALANKDEGHLLKLKHSLSSEHPIHNDKNCKRFAICRVAICEDLEKLGISERKSLTQKFPEWMPKEFQASYIRGYFDGDGWISKCAGRCWTLGLVGTKQFVKSVSCILEANDIFGVASQDKRKANGKLWYLRVSGSMSGNTRNCLSDIYSYLYDSGPSLDRKREKILQIIKNG